MAILIVFITQIKDGKKPKLIMREAKKTQNFLLPIYAAFLLLLFSLHVFAFHSVVAWHFVIFFPLISFNFFFFFFYSAAAAYIVLCLSCFLFFLLSLTHSQSTIVQEWCEKHNSWNFDFNFLTKQFFARLLSAQ